MRLVSIGCVMAGIGIAAMVAWAGIPEPDAVLYGYVKIGGERQTVADNVTVFATLGTATDPQVGSYTLGANEQAGDCYVLRIKLESLADGSQPSPDAARIGQAVHVFAKKGANPVQPLQDVSIADRGMIKGFLVTGDSNGDTYVDGVDFKPFQKCVSGPGQTPSDPQCNKEAADFDTDNDVDLRDIQMFQVCFSGPGKPANCGYCQEHSAAARSAEFKTSGGPSPSDNATSKDGGLVKRDSGSE